MSKTIEELKMKVQKNIEYFQKEELRLEDEIDELEIELSGLRMSLEHQEKMLKNF